MDTFSNLVLGFETALTLANLGYCFAGVLIGTSIGVLPGLGPTATIAMLLPLTYGLAPVSAMIMLAGIFYGAQYGGSTTAILINLPGEASAVATAIDGYQMARQGRAGAALATAALGSFFAGTVATFMIVLFSPPLAAMALEFGSPEYFSLMVLGLVASVALASGSVVKALAMVVLGLLLGLSGQDLYNGTMRFTFGLTDLIDGFDFVAVAMGVFGLAEIVRNLGNQTQQTLITKKMTGLMLSKSELKQIGWPVVRGTILGSLLGVLPGAGPMLGSFGSYMLEKKIAADPSRFGKGAIEGVAGPESANNAGAQTSFIPMLTLGLPSNAVMALMVGALILVGVTPGPNVINDQPALFWGLIASMWIGNLMLVVLNLPMIGIWVRLVSVPYHVLYPAIVAFCCIGAYSLNNHSFNVLVMAGFGVLGYVLVKLDCEPAPLLLGFVLGPMLEEHLRRALLMAHGSPSVFFTQPISAGLLLVAFIALAAALWPNVEKFRQRTFAE